MEQNEMDTFENKAPDVLLDLAKHAEAELIAKGVEPEKAKAVGIEITRRIAQAWGGSVIYIPRGLLLKLSERDSKIWQEFNGFNHQELARKFEVSVAWVYQIVKKMRKEEIARRQPDLFDA
ncbi:transcriptional regulator [Chelonobacter oris]|uniref:Mor transcription activator family protein n=1 Tax=Chelonobacter oris TaxID=505317 RepID=UPI002446B11C|nr:Mor transcription activator family protein [Chelonobacter oris]MDH3001476.1 transcriptional regulator [Chelonobacter oris]